MISHKYQPIVAHIDRHDPMDAIETTNELVSHVKSTMSFLERHHYNNIISYNNEHSDAMLKQFMLIVDEYILSSGDSDFAVVAKNVAYLQAWGRTSGVSVLILSDKVRTSELNRTFYTLPTQDVKKRHTPLSNAYSVSFEDNGFSFKELFLL